MAACRRIARLSLHRPWLATLRLASKLGDWPVWVALIALSRVGLGLHYISDVVAGAAIGWAFALASLHLAG